MSFGETIRQARLRKGYSLRECARRLNISASYLSMIEKEVQVPIESKIKSLADCLSLDMDHLMGKAGKIPNAIANMICERPQLMSFIREANQRTDAELQYLIKSTKPPKYYMFQDFWNWKKID